MLKLDEFVSVAVIDLIICYVLVVCYVFSLISHSIFYAILCDFRCCWHH